MSFVDPKGPYPPAPAQRLFGTYTAIVRDVKDAHTYGKVQIELPWIASADVAGARVDARLSTLMAGSGRGTWFVPEVDDEVLIAFMAGDPRHPVVIGSLWNGVDAPPEQMDENGDNNVRSITTESGHKLTFDDTSGQEKVKVETQGGHVLELADASGGTVTLQHSNGAKIVIDSGGTVTITANSQVNVTAPSGMKITAGMLTVNAAMSKFSGVVKCAALTTQFVNSAVYTPGAGNVW